MSKISVAMTTYNGEKYIEKQLESLRLQTRKIDEVIICDDRSKDNTEKVVTDYINKYNLTGWKFIVNEKNLGFIENFKKSMRLTTGDYIFLADQDDEWHHDKIETMTDILDKNNNIDLLSCSLQFIDQNSNSYMPETLPNWYKYMTKDNEVKLSKVDFMEICTTNYFPGCTMCMRRSLAEKYLESTYPYKIPHDWLINLLACVEEKSYFLNKPLIDYRLHSNNAIGTSSAKGSQSKEQQLDRLKSLKARYLLAKGYENIDNHQLSLNIDYVEKRINLYEKRSIKNLRQVITASKKTKFLYKNINKVNVKDILYTFHLIFK
ncbi:MAG: glycosyltransferase [Ruminococcus sp.]|nr:glycosyltransferase [Ruminococcus sp.]MDD5889890.1 glycosyltransferase [Ruminococcus sp.]MDD6709695.1 glycosyltransferase [Ruminococcus sp.]